MIRDEQAGRFGTFALEVVLLAILSFLCTAVFSLPFAGNGVRTFWTDCLGLSTSSYELLLLGVANLALFLLPVLVYPSARVYVCRAVSVGSLHRLSITWLFAWLLIALGGSYLLLTLSEWIVGLLPSSWGISSMDRVDKELERFFNIKFAYEPLCLILVLALLPAVSEELFFRAYLQRRLQRLMPDSPLVAIVLVSICFSLLHASWVGFLPRLFLGGVLGWVYYRSRNIYMSMAIHFLNNFLAVLWELVF